MAQHHTSIFCALIVLSFIFTISGCNESSNDGDSAPDSTTASGSDSGTQGMPTESEISTETEAAPQNPANSDHLTREECVRQGGSPRASLDLLVVVDKSVHSMDQLDVLRATGIYSLVNALTQPKGTRIDIIDDIRIGVVTSDMGVSYGETAFNDADNLFDNAQVQCVGMGDNATFQAEYTSADIHLEEDVIDCDASAAQCPQGWTCENLDDAGRGVCTDPNENGEGVSCPASPSDLNETFIDDTQNDIPLSAACLVNAGVAGCNYRQQLKAATFGLKNNDGFVRADSLTAVVVISDKEDCSIESDEWHELEEHQTVTANVACRRHSDLLHNVADLKTSMEATKVAAGGEATDLVFAAITGVPESPSCETTGNDIGDCFDIVPAVNGSGTLGDPDEVSRKTSAGVEQFYYEYACQRFAEGVDPEEENVEPAVAAYPATRFVQMAQQFGDRGYVASICNANWTSPMENIAKVVLDNASFTCLEP